uniref:Uncharacterized protein n=1 Tax=Chrysotila carterae TaxID=13221 RepID=A0A7S4AZX2_CHRCT
MCASGVPEEVAVLHEQICAAERACMLAKQRESKALSTKREVEDACARLATASSMTQANCRKMQEQCKQLDEQIQRVVADGLARRERVGSMFEEEIAKVSEQSADLDKEIAKLREENLSLKTKLDDFDHVHAGANPKHQQAEEHAAMLGLKLLCSNLLEIDARLVQLRTSAELWEERVSTLRSTERLQISQISTYESKRAEFSETLVSSSSVFASLDEQCAKHKSRTEELNAENVKMSAKLTGAPARRAAMRQKIAALEQEMRDLARERDEIAAECRNLQLNKGGSAA